MLATLKTRVDFVNDSNAIVVKMFTVPNNKKLNIYIYIYADFFFKNK